MIVVSNNVVDSGSGVFQANMQIYAVVIDSLSLVFNEAEKVRLAVPYKANCCPVEYVDRQTSTFDFTFAGEGRLAAIEESRHVTVNGRSIDRFRRYVWSSRWHDFYISIASGALLSLLGRCVTKPFSKLVHALP
jgi:hypothetical protein